MNVLMYSSREKYWVVSGVGGGCGGHFHWVRLALGTRNELKNEAVLSLECSSRDDGGCQYSTINVRDLLFGSNRVSHTK